MFVGTGVGVVSYRVRQTANVSQPGEDAVGTVIDVSAKDLRAQRKALLARVNVPWERLVELARAYALEAEERNIYDSVMAIDYLLGDDDD
jgi:hypothetical protein